jgi:hypothetical protein
MTKYVLIPLLLLVGGCHGRQPPAPTAEQNRQLNDAENMLNAMGSNQEGPADRSTGPSNSSD